jgi:UTP--glucose-1-phosphate uridylyltransferase
MAITKAIIPVAGIGSRTLPASKSIPKEMFPILDKPVIQYIVEEAVQSGITDIIFVTSGHKRAIEDYFDVNFEMEYRLAQKGEHDIKERIHRLAEMANFYSLRQPEPRGDGDAVLRGSALLNKGESCAVMWGDDVIFDPEPTLKKLISVYDEFHAPALALEEIPGKDVERYGVIAGTQVREGLYKISHIIEKPKLEEAPSRLSIVGRYIMTPEIVEELKNQTFAVDGEIRFSHAIRDALPKIAVYGYVFPGKRFDCGHKLGFLKANVHAGLRDPDIMDDFGRFLELYNKNAK